MSECLMCNKETDMIININLNAKPLCNSCSFTISMQTLRWLVDEHNISKSKAESLINNLPIHTKAINKIEEN